MDWDSSKEYLEDYNNLVEIKMKPNKPYNPLRLKRRMFLRKFQQHKNAILGHANIIELQVAPNWHLH